MRVLVAGGTGVVGRRLVPLLVSAGHHVVAGTTSSGKLAAVEKTGADAVVLDVLDAENTRQVVRDVKPDVIVHQATALSAMGSKIRRWDKIFDKTNELRTVGTSNLLAAARMVGVERFVAQSFCGWPFARTGSMVKNEDDPLDPYPAAPFRRTCEAIKRLEGMVTDLPGGVVLRYGGLYGPDTSLAPGGAQVEAIRKRQFPVVGDANGLFSFLHVDDAATATLAALTRGEGIYNIVDDEPAAARDWLPYLAELVGAKPPMHVPTWVARLMAGEAAVVLMTQARGGSNLRARRELQWTPAFASWRQGFRAELGSVPVVVRP